MIYELNLDDKIEVSKIALATLKEWWIHNYE